jgi:IS30 family transposase
MGAIYRHLSIEERCEVARLRTAGYSVRQIAASLDRSPSTISRELKRNGSRAQGYQPGYAHHARRWRGSKLERNDSLRGCVTKFNQVGLSLLSIRWTIAI